jgi:hypothetical protein
MTTQTCTIANGGQFSTEINVTALRIDGDTILGFRFPGAWTASAVYFYEADGQGGTYRPICDANGDIISITNPAPDGFSVDGKTIKDSSYAAIFYGVKWLKLYSASAQGAQRIIEVIKDKV